MFIPQAIFYLLKGDYMRLLNTVMGIASECLRELSVPAPPPTHG